MLQEQEFRRIVLCHQLWLKTEMDEIRTEISKHSDDTCNYLLLYKLDVLNIV